MAQLDESLYSEIQQLSASGNALCAKRDYGSARKLFIEALKLLPVPTEQWEAATWLFVAVGDTHFHEGNSEKSFKAFFNAVQCPGGLGNPFVHLRLGQAYLDLGNSDKAADELARAYMGAGIEILLEDDPKYLEFLETRMKL